MAQRPWTGGDTPDGQARPTARPSSSPGAGLRGFSRRERPAGRRGRRPRRSPPRACWPAAAPRAPSRPPRRCKSTDLSDTAEGADLLQLAALHGRGRQEVPRPSTTSRSRPASRSPTTPTSTATTSSSPRCATSSAPASRSAATSSCSPTGWPPGWSSSAGSRSSTRPTCRTSRPTCRRPSRAPLGPGPQALRPVAERPDRHRLQREVHRRGQPASRSCSPAPTSRARSRCSARWATPWASCSSWSAPTRTTSPTTSWNTRLDKMEEIVDSGQVRQFTGNDYTRSCSTTATSSPARPGRAT